MKPVLSQHHKEIKVLENQFQELLDAKDKELEEFSYRLKTMTASQNKDVQDMVEDYKARISSLEAECQTKEDSLKSKALEMRWMSAEFESTEVEIKQHLMYLTFLGQIERRKYETRKAGR